MKEELSSCPFCGYAETDPHYIDCIAVQEQIKTTIGYGIPAPEPYKIYFVSCGRCGGRGGAGVSGYNALFKKTTTEEEARQIAIDKWNRRPGAEGGRE